MHTPDLVLANYPAVYNFHEEFQPSPWVYRPGHVAMHALWPAQVEYEDGAEPEIGELLEDGTRLLLSGTHSSDRDQYSVASMAEESDTLHALRGHTRIPSKEAVFHLDPVDNPRIGKVVNPMVTRLVRWGVLHMGSVIAFRIKDVFGEDLDKSERDENLAALQREAAQRLLETRARLIYLGNHEASFDEGERNRTNWRQVQPLKRGRVDVVRAIPEHVPLAVVPIGLYYPERLKDGKLKRDYRHPAIHIGRPITERLTELSMLEEVVRPALQDNLEAAVEMVGTRWGRAAILPESELVAAIREQEERRRAARQLRQEHA